AVACFVLDPEHKVIIWTKACEELTGISAEEIVGTDQHWKAFYSAKRPCLADLIVDNILEETVDLYHQYSASRLIAEGVQAEGWFPKVGGRERYLFFEAAPVRNQDGQLIAAIETLQDLSSLKYAERSLIESEQSHRSLIDRSPEAIVVHRAGTVLFANIAAARLFGASSPDQLKRREITTLLHPDSRGDLLKGFDLVETSLIDKSCVEERILRVDGNELEVESSSAPVYYGGAWSVQTILRDITQRKEQQELVWRQANYDTLTQIPNRMLFNDRLRQAVELSLREQKPCGVMYIDLDGFKAINDNLGHDAGDMLLREVAERLTGIIRKSDTVARLGGDEFAVIISNLVEPTNVGVIARHILSELARPFQLAGAPRKISGSIGIAMFPSDADDIQALIKCADSAMYRAKQGGKNTFCFFAKDDAESFGGKEV
ncbi:MAG: diguanylate cyclase domain-containing protein, partial [Desulfuromonadales bacterium]